LIKQYDQSNTMKRTFLNLVVVLLLSSCISRSYLVKIDDPYKEIKGIKLMQNVIGRSADKAASINGNQYYSINYAYLLEIKKDQQPSMSLDVQMQTPIRTDELDSVMFLNLGNEKIRMVAFDSKLKKIDKSLNVLPAPNNSPTLAERAIITENGSYQLMSQQFTVPENLWLYMVTAEKIQYRLYIGKEGIDVKLNPTETTKLHEFFSQAIKCRTEIVPSVSQGK